MKTLHRIVAFLLFLFLVLTAAAVEKPYASGKILDVEQKAHTRVLYYLVNTPVTQDDPYFEVTVQVGNVTYVGEFTPRHAKDTLPEEWITDAPVDVRLEKHYLYLKRPSGSEVPFVIVKHSKPEEQQSSTPPSGK